MAAAKQDSTKAKNDGKGKPTDPTPAKAAKKCRKLMPAIAVAALLAAVGGGAWWHFSSPSDAAPGATPAKPPVFVALETFTVNLLPEDGHQQYLQIGLTLKAPDQAAADRIKQNMPEIRNRILLLLSARKASNLLADAGKRALAKDIMDEMIAVLAPELAQAAKRPVPPVTVAQAPAESTSDAPITATPGDAVAAGPADAAAAPGAAQGGADAVTQPPPTAETKSAPTDGPQPPVSSVLFTSFIIQ